MGGSLLDDILKQEEELLVRIATEKQHIRENLAIRQAELEARFTELKQRLQKRYAARQQLELQDFTLQRAALKRELEQRIGCENALADESILQFLDELLGNELLRSPNDHPDVQN